MGLIPTDFARTLPNAMGDWEVSGEGLRFSAQDPSNPDPDSRYTVWLDGEKLFARIGRRETALSPIGRSVFLSKDGLIEFLVADDGRVPTLISQGATPYHRVGGEFRGPKA